MLSSITACRTPLYPSRTSRMRTGRHVYWLRQPSATSSVPRTSPRSSQTARISAISCRSNTLTVTDVICIATSVSVNGDCHTVGKWIGGRNFSVNAQSKNYCAALQLLGVTFYFCHYRKCRRLTV